MTREELLDVYDREVQPPSRIVCLTAARVSRIAR